MHKIQNEKTKILHFKINNFNNIIINLFCTFLNPNLSPFLRCK